MFDPVRGNKSFSLLWEDAGYKNNMNRSWDKARGKGNVFNIKLINFYDLRGNCFVLVCIELERDPLQGFNRKPSQASTIYFSLQFPSSLHNRLQLSDAAICEAYSSFHPATVDISQKTAEKMGFAQTFLFHFYRELNGMWQTRDKKQRTEIKAINWGALKLSIHDMEGGIYATDKCSRCFDPKHTSVVWIKIFLAFVNIQL